MSHSDSSKRIRKLTHKAMELFMEKVDELDSTLLKAHLFAQQEMEKKRNIATIQEQEQIAKAASDKLKPNLQHELKLLSERKELTSAEADLDALNQIETCDPCDDERLNIQDRTAKFVMNIPTKIEHFSPAEHLIQDPSVRYPSINQNRHNNIESHACGQTSLNDVSNFLPRKELVMCRLIKFNDRADNYIAWRASSKNVAKELKVNAAEELDL